MNRSDEAFLLIGESNHHADMYHAIGFLFNDPVIYLRHGHAGGDTLVCSNFERDEAARLSTVREVITPEDLGAADLRRQALDRHTAYAETVFRLLQRYGVTAVTIAAETPVHVVDYLRPRGITVTCRPDGLRHERLVKTKLELEAIEITQRATEEAMAQAIALIAASEVRDGLLSLEGAPLTAERLRLTINIALLQYECLGEGTIVACGADAASPHHPGSGPLRPHAPIVIDIFPQHQRLRYFADMTRTVSKGDPGPDIQRMYEVTMRAQAQACGLIRPGADGQAVYEAACAVFEEAGYPTSLASGAFPSRGFLHGLGHGVGLEIHEGPALSRGHDPLAAGQVVTVEPGLYEPGRGGVRIEDLVVVTEDGCRNLTHFEKRLVV